MKEHYLWDSGIKHLQMRLLIEGALALYEDQAQMIMKIATMNKYYEAAAAFEAIGSALCDLRDVLIELQEVYRDAVLSGNEAE